MFFEVVVPLLTVEGTGLVAISTPRKKLSWFGELVSMKMPDGRPLFRVIQITGKCNECKKNPRYSHRPTCPHNAHYTPPWKGMKRGERVMKIMEKHKNLIQTEIEAEFVDEGGQQFSNEDVDRFLERAPYHDIGYKAKHFFIACDPASTGKSDTALVAGFLDENGHAVVSNTHIHTHNNTNNNNNNNRDKKKG